MKRITITMDEVCPFYTESDFGVAVEVDEDKYKSYLSAVDEVMAFQKVMCGLYRVGREALEKEIAAQKQGLGTLAEAPQGMTFITPDNFDDLFNCAKEKLAVYTKSQKTFSQVKAADFRSSRTLGFKGQFKRDVGAGMQLYLCSRCGAIDSAGYATRDKGSRMVNNQVCSICDLWEQRSLLTPDTYLVIEGDFYVDGDGEYATGTGKEFAICRDGRTWKTRNLLFGDTVPQEFRTLFPDNATFASNLK